MKLDLFTSWLEGAEPYQYTAYSSDLRNRTPSSETRPPGPVTYFE